jgi:hypothetical protein
MKVKLHSGHCPLRAVIITGGIGASILFVIVGVITRTSSGFLDNVDRTART